VCEVSFARTCRLRKIYGDMDYDISYSDQVNWKRSHLRIVRDGVGSTIMYGGFYCKILPGFRLSPPMTGV
jgi:hypothetical protein